MRVSFPTLFRRDLVADKRIVLPRNYDVTGFLMGSAAAPTDTFARRTTNNYYTIARRNLFRNGRARRLRARRAPVYFIFARLRQSNPGDTVNRSSLNHSLVSDPVNERRKGNIQSRTERSINKSRISPPRRNKTAVFLYVYTYIPTNAPQLGRGWRWFITDDNFDEKGLVRVAKGKNTKKKT